LLGYLEGCDLGGISLGKEEIKWVKPEREKRVWLKGEGSLVAGQIEQRVGETIRRWGRKDVIFLEFGQELF